MYVLHFIPSNGLSFPAKSSQGSPRQRKINICRRTLKMGIKPRNSSLLIHVILSSQQSHSDIFLSFFLSSPEFVVPKESPIQNVEQNEARGEEPARNSIDEHGFFTLLLHHVPNLLLPLQLDIVHQISNALLVYHTVRRARGRPRISRTPRCRRS